VDRQSLHGDAAIVGSRGKFSHGQIRMQESDHSGQLTGDNRLRCELIRELDGGVDLHVWYRVGFRPVLVFRRGGCNCGVLLRQEEVLCDWSVGVRQRNRYLHLRTRHAMAAGGVWLARDYLDPGRSLLESRRMRLSYAGSRMDHHSSESEDTGEAKESREKAFEDAELQRGLILCYQFREYDHANASRGF